MPKMQSASDQPNEKNGGSPRTSAGVSLEVTALVISGYLARHGSCREAAHLLEQFIKLVKANGSSISLEPIIALARIVYEVRSWGEAAQCWNFVAVNAPRNIEALTKLSHSLIELGDQEAADRTMAKMREALQQPCYRKDVTDFDSLLELVYRQIHFHFEKGNQEKCEKLLEICAVPNTYAGTVLGVGMGSECILSDEAIIRKIESAFHTWHRTERYLQNDDPATSVSPGSKLKVLMLFRKYFLGGTASREHELPLLLKESAQAFGFETFHFPAEYFRTPDRMTPEKEYKIFDDFLRVLIEMKPNLVIIDDLGVLDPPAPNLGREVFKQALVQLRKELGFKLIGFYPDPWMSESVKGIEYASSFVDVIWHQNVTLARSSRSHADKLFSAPIPYPMGLFRSGSFKTIGAGFLGSVYSYNYLRAVWCTLIRSRGIPCHLFLTRHLKNQSSAGDTIQEYGAFCSRMRIMVNFSARNPSTRVITGRVWESILAKALLLEEENDEITHHFAPFVHYIPFKNIAELETYIRFFERHEMLRRQIVEEAYAWFQRRYSPERVWRNLLAAAFSPAQNLATNQKSL